MQLLPKDEDAMIRVATIDVFLLAMAMSIAFHDSIAAAKDLITNRQVTVDNWNAVKVVEPPPDPGLYKTATPTDRKALCEQSVDSGQTDKDIIVACNDLNNPELQGRMAACSSVERLQAYERAGLKDKKLAAAHCQAYVAARDATGSVDPLKEATDSLKAIGTGAQK
jgi:hypothetical protein